MGPVHRPRVKLTDFGLAKSFVEQQGLVTLTRFGDIGGSVGFISPDHILNFSEAREPADIYCAATTLFYLLTNRYPYLGFDPTTRRVSTSSSRTPPCLCAPFAPKPPRASSGFCSKRCRSSRATAGSRPRQWPMRCGHSCFRIREDEGAVRSGFIRSGNIQLAPGCFGRHAGTALVFSSSLVDDRLKLRTQAEPHRCEIVINGKERRLRVRLPSRPGVPLQARVRNVQASRSPG